MPQTYIWEIVERGPSPSGTVIANSEAHAKRLARKATGQKWGKKWKKGWHINSAEEFASWVGDNDYDPYAILWVYIPKEQNK